jgi:hypothetical protein
MIRSTFRAIAPHRTVLRLATLIAVNPAHKRIVPHPQNTANPVT